MPKELHARLEKQARKMGLMGDRKNAYVYPTLRKVEKRKKRKGKKK